MRKSKGEYIIEALKLILDYLHNHPIQARMFWFFLGMNSILKICPNEIVLIINAFK